MDDPIAESAPVDSMPVLVEKTIYPFSTALETFLIVAALALAIVALARRRGRFEWTLAAGLALVAVKNLVFHAMWNGMLDMNPLHMHSLPTIASYIGAAGWAILVGALFAYAFTEHESGRRPSGGD